MIDKNFPSDETLQEKSKLYSFPPNLEIVYNNKNKNINVKTLKII